MYQCACGLYIYARTHLYSDARARARTHTHTSTSGLGSPSGVSKGVEAVEAGVTLSEVGSGSARSRALRYSWADSLKERRVCQCVWVRGCGFVCGGWVRGRVRYSRADSLKERRVCQCMWRGGYTCGLVGGHTPIRWSPPSTPHTPPKHRPNKQANTPDLCGLGYSQMDVHEFRGPLWGLSVVLQGLVPHPCARARACVCVCVYSGALFEAFR